VLEQTLQPARQGTQLPLLSTSPARHNLQVAVTVPFEAVAMTQFAQLGSQEGVLLEVAVGSWHWLLLRL
jgi:hypothetical protein